jgi:hypothetical protein
MSRRYTERSESGRAQRSTAASGIAAPHSMGAIVCRAPFDVETDLHPPSSAQALLEEKGTYVRSALLVP